MFPEDHIVLNMNDIHNVFNIMLTKILQDLKFNGSLIVVLLLILDNLDSNLPLLLMIKALQCSPKAALAQKLLDLISIANVISHDHLVVTLIVIVSIVILVLLVFRVFNVAIRLAALQALVDCLIELAGIYFFVFLA